MLFKIPAGGNMEQDELRSLRILVNNMKDSIITRTKEPGAYINSYYIRGYVDACREMIDYLDEGI